MPSTLTYSRLIKEVPGIYIVQVRFELPWYREAEVFVGRERDRGYHCSEYAGGSCGLQRQVRCYPINPLEVESFLAREYEEIGNFWVKDTITIEIHDKRLAEYGGGPYQIMLCTATMNGIDVKALPCKLHGRIWEPMMFHEIAVIDGGEYVPAPITQIPAQVLVQNTQVSKTEEPDFVPLHEAIIHLQSFRYGYLTDLEIATIAEGFPSDDGKVDFTLLKKTVRKANGDVKVRLARQTRQQGVSRKETMRLAAAEVKAENKRIKLNAQEEPLALRQAERIIKDNMEIIS